MYSFTRCVMATQLARMQRGNRNVVSSTNGMEMPSMPIWKLIGPSQGLSSTNWNCAVSGSKSRHNRSDSAKVISVVHNAI